MKNLSSMNPMKKINVAVIGAGYWGPNLIRNFAQIEKANLAYVCDIDEKKLEAAKKIYPYIRITKDYHEILRDKDVDAIVIALPVGLHYKLAKDALEAGKNVLIEKPFTSSVKQAQELVSIAKKNKLALMVDHTFEYSEPIKKMKEIINSGELGDIYYVRAEWLNLGLLQPDVNVIWDLATHIISIINYALNQVPKKVSANATGYLRESIPEVGHLHLKYGNGMTAFLTVSWLEPRKTRCITIVGNKKMLVYDLTNTEEQIKIYHKGVDITKIGDERQHRINYKYGDIYSPQIKNIEPLNTMCAHFIDCIVEGKTPSSDGMSGLNVVKILEASDKSLKERREIELNEDD